jgi:alcohol dehydrogenase
VMRFNLPVREAEIARIAELLGEDVRGCSHQEAAERGIAAVERLRQAIGIPTRIREFGGTADHLPDLAAKTFAIKRLLAMTPREPTEDDILAIYQEAL